MPHHACINHTVITVMVLKTASAHVKHNTICIQVYIMYNAILHLCTCIAIGMWINKSGGRRRLDSANNKSGHSVASGSGGVGLLNVHRTCTMLVKLTIVLLIATQLGNVQAKTQTSQITNNLSGISSKSDINELFTFNHGRHRQNPTFYKRRHNITPHRTTLDRSSQKDTKSGYPSKVVDLSSDSNQNLKVDSDNGSKCIITVIDETNLPGFHNCNCSTVEDSANTSLDSALSCMDHYKTNVELRLESDYFTLNEVHSFDGLSTVRITGRVEHTHIECNSTHESGLIFVNSTNVTLEGITLSGCGARHISTSVNFITKSDVIYTFSAIYISHCSNVTFINVAIKSSDGAGLTMVNCGGTVNIARSNFTKNGIKTSTSIPAGGGISIEICFRNDCSNAISTTDSWTNAMYYIQDCLFIDNNASVGKFLPTHITSNKNYFIYGQGGGLFVNFVSSNNLLIVSNSYFEGNKAQRGGGLFIGFRTDTEGNNVRVQHCTFLQNSCYNSDLPPGEKHSSGGAMGVIFYTNMKRSNFSISNTKFTKNTAYYGGGISMGTGSTYFDDKIDSTDRCNFTIQWSVFDGNNARIGAALDLYYRVAAEQLHHYSSVLTKIFDTNFTRNGGVYHYSKPSATGRTFATIYIVYIPVVFYGNIHIVNNTASGFGIEEATVKFNESALVNLTRNTAKIGGGMALIGRSTIVLHENTTVIFHLNKASERGGAIFSTQSQERYTAYDYTCFIQYKNYDNSKEESIGLHPSCWKASITFSNNTANSSDYKRNAIYASSVLPCVWPSNSTSKLSYDISSTFCGWNGSWIFSGTNGRNCTDLISTAPSNFTRNTYHGITGAIEVTPGNLTKIPDFGVQDDFGHKMSSALYTVSNITVTCKCKKKDHTRCEKNWPQDIGISVTDDGLLLKADSEEATTNYNMKNCNFTILLQTADRKSITTKIHITILRCPPGYKIHKASKSCQCQKKHYFNGLLSCTQSNFTSSIFAGNCITFSNLTTKQRKRQTDFIVARCPYVVGNLKSLYVELPPYGVHMTEDAFCQPFNRSGKLCGECQKGLGLDVYSASFNCTKCGHIHINWIKVVAASTVPTTLLFILCTIFHISITSAPINGYIFFSHMITMRLDVLTVRYLWATLNDKHSLSRVLHVPYQLWTFDFPQILLQGICLGKSFKVVHALALQYLSVLYPLLLVFIAIILIELHAKNCKPLVWLWKPLCYLCIRFRHSWHIRTTVIDTFASFLLLSYSNLIGVSMSLLTPSKVILSNGTVVGRILNYDTSVEFFGDTHLKYGIFAIIILCTFGAIPPILLILYPFKWFQYMLNRCNLRGWRFLHVFVDAFQGSYKNGIKGYPERRYFAGVYFLFRIAINIIYLAVEDMINLHLILTLTYTFFMLILMAQRPYKKNFYNILDGVFMSILVTTQAMTVYLFYHASAFNKVPENAWYFTYSIQHIPTLYMILLVTYLVSFRMRCVKRFCLTHFSGRSLFFKNDDAFSDKNSPKSPLINYDWPSSSSLVIPSPSSPFTQSRNISDIPDRVENPQRYEQLADSWQYPDQKSSLQDFSGVVSKNSKNIPDYGSSLN